MALREFKLPDPGEGLTEADLVTWHVAVGDTVKVNDIVVEVETAKSLVELPVPFAGTVAALHAAEGDTVDVGSVIITIEDGVGGSPDAVAPAPAAAAPPAEAASDAGAPSEEIAEGLIGGTTSTGRTAVLVGYGVKQTEAKRRPRAGQPGRAAPRRRPARQLVERRLARRSQRPRIDRLRSSSQDRRLPRPAVPESTNRSPQGQPVSGEQVRALAKPPVRKLAKDLGLDLAAITPTGAGRRRHASRRRGGGRSATPPRHPHRPARMPFPPPRAGAAPRHPANGRSGCPSRACAR